MNIQQRGFLYFGTELYVLVDRDKRYRLSNHGTLTPPFEKPDSFKRATAGSGGGLLVAGFGSGRRMAPACLLRTRLPRFGPHVFALKSL